ncbi:polysaccharide biosynthesis protein [Desulfolucanica intricata]|uniref:polysaccharide biosynthesis protein n=1 Tax=Desulfolucanica intricata TaxID=1285191 RepID=UPI000B2A5CB4|nr:nucleoside-diphosphate sugar epimerase/dehydratase [Desulfolucanica intricata]
MSYIARVTTLMLCDFFLVNLAMLTALLIRFYESQKIGLILDQYLYFAPVSAIILVGFFYIFKLYQKVWAYASVGELVAIAKAVSVGTAAVIAITFFVSTPLPRSVVLMSWAFNLLFIGGSRLAWRMHVHKKKNGAANGLSTVVKKRTLIVGAGDAGVLIVRELKNHDSEYLPLGFVDDDKNKQNMTVMDVPVVGTRKQLPWLIEKYGIEEVIIAMPSVPGKIVQETVELCKKTPVKLKILPGVYQLINGNVTVNHLRDVQVEDLLGREPVNVDLHEIAGYLLNKVVLVTGAGGSIGSELCRQVAKFNPKLLVVLGHGENSIHNIVLELKEAYMDRLPVEIVIADIRDKQKIDQVFETYKPSVVFHAAAHKHVPLMELHPDEAVKTNIFGTRNVAEAADRVGTDIFVMISTDKAVNPSSVMGATKRIAELIIQQLNSVSDTTFTAVRFGNVLGSNGSVVPIFKRQIAKGGPVTVTHPEMKRYFMTIPEAVQLVVQAGAIAKGGEVFVLDMGEPVKIVDLAKCMINLSGLEPERDIEIKFTGIRPGEKLFEELLTAEEGSKATKHKRIFVARTAKVDLETLVFELVKLKELGSKLKAKDVFNSMIALVPNMVLYRKDMTG